MNEHARAWVDALRSGEFEQARNTLRTKNGYCCLGVACELWHRETGKGEWIEKTSYIVFADASNVHESGHLPCEVRDWLGLRSDNGRYLDAGHIRTLASRNDGGSTFEQIADIIESEPEGLFNA